MSAKNPRGKSNHSDEVVSGDSKKIHQEIRELRTVTDNLFDHFEDLSDRVDTLESDLREIKQNQEKMMGNIDFIVGALQDRRQEEAMGTMLMNQHGSQIADHEKRIRTLEAVA